MLMATRIVDAQQHLRVLQAAQELDHVDLSILPWYNIMLECNETNK
jgi:hypothetical protein